MTTRTCRRTRSQRRLLGLTLGLALVAPLLGPWSGPVAAQEAPAGADAAYGRMLLVLDSSGSMAEPAGGGQSKIEAAKDALATVIGDLPAESEVGLRVFGSEVFSRDDAGACRDSRLVVEPGTDNRDALLEAVDSYEPYGETPIPHALQEAAADLGDEGTRSIVLVSDGESTCTPDPCVVAGQIAEQGIDLRVDVVGLSVSGKAREQLRCIAERGNGTYYDADDAGDIEATLTRVSERAIRPFVLTGEPVEGGTDVDPTPVGVGDWVDTLGPEDRPTSMRHYVVTRTTPGSTLRVSAITQGGRDWESLHTAIYAPDGHQCDYTIDNRLGRDTRRVMGGQATARGEDDDCGAPGDYLVLVRRRVADEGTVPFGLRVREEPPVVDTGFVSDGEVDLVAPQVSGKPTRVPGGHSFANASGIGPGRWESTLVPGEAAMFALPLDYGQAARVRVRFPQITPAMERTIDAAGAAYTTGQVVLYNPMQASLDHPQDAEWSSRIGFDEPTTFLTATPPVSREHDDSDADHSLAGTYYLAVSASETDHTVELPYTIDVEVVGEPAEGPTYADGATWSVADGAAAVGDEVTDGTPDPTASESPTDEAEADTAAGAEEDSGSLLPTWLAVLVGLVGLAAVAGAALLWRRSR